MKILSAGKTDKGKTRKNNEDAFVVDDALGLYAAADGIGGHVGGEVASRLAVDTLSAIVRDHADGKASTPPYGLSPDTEPAVSALKYAFTLANVKMLQSADRDPALAGMGTTMTALLFRGRKGFVAHVGDSRAYLLRAGALSQVTEDHSVVAEQMRAGLITPAQARTSAHRHVITRALGIDPEIIVDHHTLEIRQNDTFLLCTDGLTEMVEDREIARLLADTSPQAAAENLVISANDRGGVDNITVVVVRVEDLR